MGSYDTRRMLAEITPKAGDRLVPETEEYLGSTVVVSISAP